MWLNVELKNIGSIKVVKHLQLFTDKIVLQIVFNSVYHFVICKRAKQT